MILRDDLLVNYETNYYGPEVLEQNYNNFVTKYSEEYNQEYDSFEHSDMSPDEKNIARYIRDNVNLFADDGYWENILGLAKAYYKQKYWTTRSSDRQVGMLINKELKGNTPVESMLNKAQLEKDLITKSPVVVIEQLATALMDCEICPPNVTFSRSDIAAFLRNRRYKVTNSEDEEIADERFLNTVSEIVMFCVPVETVNLGEAVYSDSLARTVFKQKNGEDVTSLIYSVPALMS